MALLELQGITKSYPLADREIRAVLSLSASIFAGDFVSIVGHSGSGKSTLLSIMGGILQPDSGSVLLDGRDLWKTPDRILSGLRNRTFGFVFQFPSLVPTLTAAENVLLPSLFGAPARRTDALDLLHQVGLGDKPDRYSSELSGGEQQRVAIARALITRPRIVLADEPTGDLDENTEAEIMRFLERVNREQGVTVVMVTHSTELARQAGRRFRMEQGVLGEVPSERAGSPERQESLTGKLLKKP